jgi:hypothetical protein
MEGNKQVPEDARPDYHLWHPMCNQEGDRVLCSFDVTAPELTELRCGDREVMAAFADALGLGSARVQSWRIERFCTPYYAYDHRSDDWRERVELAWRVEMELTGRGPFFHYGGLGPAPAYGRDSTWTGDDSIWNGEPEPCIVIADEGPSGEFSFLHQVARDSVVDVFEYRVPERVLKQARVKLGVLELPRDYDQIASIVEACRLRLAATHWSITEQRPLWQKSRLP